MLGFLCVMSTAAAPKSFLTSGAHLDWMIWYAVWRDIAGEICWCGIGCQRMSTNEWDRSPQSEMFCNPRWWWGRWRWAKRLTPHSNQTSSPHVGISVCDVNCSCAKVLFNFWGTPGLDDMVRRLAWHSWWNLLMWHRMSTNVNEWMGSITTKWNVLQPHSFQTYHIGEMSTIS